jgi:hypothetical protein
MDFIHRREQGFSKTHLSSSSSSDQQPCQQGELGHACIDACNAPEKYASSQREKRKKENKYCKASGR